MPRWTKSSTSRRWADPSCPASAASRSCTRGDCQPIAWRCDDSPRSGRVRHNFDLRPAHRASSAPVESETRAILGITGLVGRGEGRVEENEFSFCVQSGGSVLSRISFHWPTIAEQLSLFHHHRMSASMDASDGVLTAGAAEQQGNLPAPVPSRLRHILGAQPFDSLGSLSLDFLA